MNLYKSLVVILVILLTLPIAFAQDKFFYRAEDVTFNVKVSSNIHLISTSPNAEIDYVKANLSYFPKETDRQKIISMNNVPNAEASKDSILYQWRNPTKSPLEFLSLAKVKVNNIPAKIKSKVEFPIKEEDIPDEVKIYTKPGEIIDSDNKAVIAKASELAEGEDDLFNVMHKLAGWTKSKIEYSLDTLTANASQKASWVLEHREGVCDELTALFIAMARSLGIPAKYVSGLAYTNYNNINDWGPHAWAEVYFPGYGWVAYDVTYGEFGFIDGSHITLKESADASTSSSRYEWRSYNVDIQTEKLEFNVKPIDASADFAEEISLRLSPITDEVKFGSYNLVEAKVQNLQDYYISTEIYLARPQEVKILEEERLQVMLKPKEKKSVFWLVQVSSLDDKFIYTFPMEVFLIKNESAKSAFKTSSNGQYNSREEMEAIIKANLEETKVYSKKIEIKCEPSKSEFYIYEKTDVNCNIKNLGNILLKDLRVCLQKDCKKVDLGINQQDGIAFNVLFNASGEKQIPITVSGFEASKSAIVKLKVLDIPRLEINELEFTSKVKYGQEFEIKFKADKKSESDAKNARIVIKSNSIVKQFDIANIQQSSVYKIKLNGKDLSEGENDFDISITYYDGNNREYATSKEFMIELVDVNIVQKILLFINKVLGKIG